MEVPKHAREEGMCDKAAPFAILRNVYRHCEDFCRHVDRQFNFIFSHPYVVMPVTMINVDLALPRGRGAGTAGYALVLVRF